MYIIYYWIEGSKRECRTADLETAESWYQICIDKGYDVKLYYSMYDEKGWKVTLLK